MSNNQLEDKLKAAFRDDFQLRYDFYNYLLESTILVPFLGQSKQTPILIGENNANQYYSIEKEDSRLYPFFSSRESFLNWSQDVEIPYEEIEFKKFIFLLPQKAYMHLNPSSEYGKEFSDWEIDNLKKGKEYIEEIVLDGLEEDPNPFLVTENAKHLFKDLVNDYIVVLEAYSFVAEAFLIFSYEDTLGDAKEKKLLVALKCDSLNQEKLEQLTQELETIFEKSSYVKEYPTFGVVPDISDMKVVFDDVTPFYIRLED